MARNEIRPSLRAMRVAHPQEMNASLPVQLEHHLLSFGISDDEDVCEAFQQSLNVIFVGDRTRLLSDPNLVSYRVHRVPF
jgi:hypothetical protein